MTVAPGRFTTPLRLLSMCQYRGDGDVLHLERSNDVCLLAGVVFALVLTLTSPSS
jgi:hypothetical protein